ncbi:MAG: hypothetical protein HY925_14455 [Elusimicrobia bacterium]|nr:hypothetical protein [Elusimicrobiota bacterium]
MEALALALLLAAPARAKEPPAPTVVNLKIHGYRASVWVTIDAKGTLKLREEIPDDVARKPRRVIKKLGKKAVANLLRDAGHAGFFELEERYAESENGTTSWRLELVPDEGKKVVSVYGDPPPAFQTVVDRIEELYGKPLLPGLAKGARRPMTPGRTPEQPSPAPLKDDRSKEWEE